MWVEGEREGESEKERKELRKWGIREGRKGKEKTRRGEMGPLEGGPCACRQSYSQLKKEKTGLLFLWRVAESGGGDGEAASSPC